MSSIKIGSAKIDERGKISGGQAGDQTGNEVAVQNFYIHSKGWNVLRAKSVTYANSIAERMKKACSNSNIGYDQSNRNGIIKYGIDTSVKTECDCSSLVRQCVKEACGTDPGNFTTANEKTALINTGLFEFIGKYNTGMNLFDGDILVTCTKGHTVVVISGNPRDVSSSAPAAAYSRSQFIKDVQIALGFPSNQIDGKAVDGGYTISHTITVSKKSNKHHKVVTVLERYLKQLGYYTGEIEADNGKTPWFGNGMESAVISYQKNVVKATAKNCDGIITSRAATWKKLLGII